MAVGRRPSNEALLQQLREGNAKFELVSLSISPWPLGLRFFARIGSSLNGISPAMKKEEHYSVLKVTGDGRCMFRALVKGMSRNKGLKLNPNQETNDADELRMAVKEVMCDNGEERLQYEEALVAITLEESLKRYCQRIGHPGFWGGESELLVLSRICRQPIVVYIPVHEHTPAAGSNGFIPIAEYGSEFKKPKKGKRRMVPALHTIQEQFHGICFPNICMASPTDTCLGIRKREHLRFFFRKKLTDSGQRSLVVSRANRRKEKPDDHSFIPKPDEATGPFPEAVLLKKKVVKEDGRFVPEFADAEEEKLYEFLKLQLESDLKLERIRHYEVVYLIHEDHIEEVDNVVSKVQVFIKEKKGRIWRLNNWGLRRLSYKIKKASKANYILMNFEIEAKWINDFKNMLDKDERIIRHLVMKRDEAITEDCPPPPEFHTVKEATQGIDDAYEEEEDDDEEDDEDQWLDDDDDDELGMQGDDFEDVDDNDSVIDSEVSSPKKLKEKITSR